LLNTTIKLRPALSPGWLQAMKPGERPEICGFENLFERI
jgi:hypothetical protein